MRLHLFEDDLEGIVAGLPGRKDEFAETDSGVEAWESSACPGCSAKERGRITAEELVPGVKTVRGEVLDGCSAT